MHVAYPIQLAKGKEWRPDHRLGQNEGQPSLAYPVQGKLAILYKAQRDNRVKHAVVLPIKLLGQAHKRQHPCRAEPG